MKKGFTLTEMLAVLVILGIITLIAYPIITSSLSSYREKLHISQVENIKDAAKSYVADNVDKFNCSESGFTEEVTLEVLMDEGYINETLIDPSTNEAFPSTSRVIVTCKTTNDNYKYTYTFES